MRLEKLANRTLAQNSQDTHNFLCCFAAHPKASCDDELTRAAAAPAAAPQLAWPAACRFAGLVMRETTPKTAAATALGQIPGPRCKVFGLLPRRVCTFYVFNCLSLSLFSSSTLRCLSLSYFAAHVFTK